MTIINSSFNAPKSAITNPYISSFEKFFLNKKNTDAGFVQINKIEGKSVQNGEPNFDSPVSIESFEGEIVSCGKNLFDLNRAIPNANSKISIDKDTIIFNGGQTLDYNIFLPKGTTIIFNYKKSFETETKEVYAVRYNNAGDGEGKIGVPYTLIEDAYQLGIGITGTTSVENLIISEIMLEIVKDEETTPSKYEPFVGTRTEKIVLRSTPQGVRDTLERLPNGKLLLTKNVEHMQFDETEEIEVYDGGVTNSQNKYVHIYSKPAWYAKNSELPENFKMGDIYSNYFKGYENLYFEDAVGIQLGAGGVETVQAHTIRFRSSELKTVKEVKNKLKEWKNNKVPLEVYYLLNNPVKKEISLNSLSSFDKETNIFFTSKISPFNINYSLMSNYYSNKAINNIKENIFENKPNKNLLFNSDFRNPINTSGKTSYYGESDNLQDIDGYNCIDGWLLRNQSTRADLKNGFLRLINNNSNLKGGRGFNQILKKEDIEGKVLTLSFFINNINNKNVYRFSLRGNTNPYSNSSTITVPSDILVDKTGYYSFTFKVNNNLSIYDYVVFGIFTNIGFSPEMQLNDFIDIEWIKLEEGERATPYIRNELDYSYMNIKSRNSNILINPNFFVNQRNNLIRLNSPQINLTSTKTYFSDCWKVKVTKDRTGKVRSLKNGGIEFTNTSTNSANFVATYMMEDSKAEQYHGKKMTLTWCFGPLKRTKSVTYVFDKNKIFLPYFSNIGDYAFEHKEVDILKEGIFDVRLTLEPNETNIIHWVKLEEGDAFTGYEEPDYETELAKCQYFYKKLYVEQYLTIVDKNSSLLIPLTNRILMRKTPTIKWTYDNVNFITASKTILLTDKTFTSSNDGYDISINNLTEIPVGTMGTVGRTTAIGNFLTTRAVLELNAEI